MLKRYFILYPFFFLFCLLSVYADNNQTIKPSSTSSIAEYSNAALAIQDVSIQEGEGLSKKEDQDIEIETYDNLVNDKFLDNYINKAPIQTSFFNGFRVNEVFSHAMLNPLKRTGHPLFMLQARERGILSDDYLYVGGKAAVIDWNRVNRNNNGGASKQFSTLVDGYIASTMSKWVSTLASVSIYNDDNGTQIYPYSLYFIVGDLSESPYFGYIASSAIMYGNFEIVSNFVPTLTRLYFMQAGGNANISYHTESVHLNAVLLNSNPSSYFGTTNADSKGGVGFSLNSKYTYEMSNLGEYQYVGLAYSNVSGFNSNSGGTVGTINLNYGAAISDINFVLEGLITDKGVSEVNFSSPISTNKISGVPFFGSIRPDSGLIYDNFLTSGDVVSTWSAQTSYTYNAFNKRLIPYVNYSHILQNSDNYAYQYGTGARYNLMYSSWLGLDYTSITTKSPVYKSTQNYLSISYVIYV